MTPISTISRVRTDAKRSRCGYGLVALACLCAYATLNVRSREDILGKGKKNGKAEPSSTVSSPNPIRLRELVYQSAGLAAGAFFLKHGVPMIRKKLESMRLKSGSDSSPAEPVLESNKLQEFGMESGRVTRNSSLTSNIELLGTGVHSEGCFGSPYSVTLLGSPKAIAGKNLVDGLLENNDPTIIAIKVRKPIYRRRFLRQLQRGMMSWYNKTEKSRTYSVIRKASKDLEKALPPVLEPETQIRFDIVPTFGEIAEVFGQDLLVEMIIDKKTIGIVKSPILARQLISMVVGPKPLSKSAKTSISDFSKEIKATPSA